MDVDSTVERVLLVVTLIPLGRVVTYGDIGELVGTSARRVGTIMNRYGAGVPWWRVVRSTGGLPGPLLLSGWKHWAAEGITPTPTRLVPLPLYRADLVALADAYERLGGPLSRVEG